MSLSTVLALVLIILSCMDVFYFKSGKIKKQNISITIFNQKNSRIYVIAVSDIVSNIDEKVRLLVEKLKVLESENHDLVDKNQALLEQNRTLQTDLLLRNSEISHLKKQVGTQDGDSVEVYERKHYLRKEIDQYIQDIDKCIEWLQNA